MGATGDSGGGLEGDPVRTLALTLFLAACQPPPVVPGAIAADGELVITVNGKPMTSRVVDAAARRIPAEQVAKMKADPQQWGGFVDTLALTQVLYDEAIAAGLHNDPKVQDMITMVAREQLSRELLTRKGDEAVTDAKLMEAYEKKAVQYGKPQARASHVLVKDEALANEIKAKADAGADFAELAKTHSTDKGSAVKGGDLGWFDQNRMVKEFSDAAFAATPGQIIGPIQTRFGFHIIKVVEKRDKTPFEDVRNDLAVAARREATDAYVQEKKASLKLERTPLAGESPPAQAPGRPQMPHGMPPGMPPGGAVPMGGGLPRPSLSPTPAPAPTPPPAH